MSSKPRRRNTYVIDKVSEDNHQHKDKVGSSGGGIKALLDKANKGHFPAEVKAYINSHFWMIREENLRLNQDLDKANLGLQQYKSQVKDLKEAAEDLKAVKSQLDREKAKNKALMKKYKSTETNNNNDVIWMQTTNLPEMMPEIRPITAALTSNMNNEEKKLKMLNKTLKSLRAEVANLQADKAKLTKVVNFDTLDNWQCAFRFLFRRFYFWKLGQKKK